MPSRSKPARISARALRGAGKKPGRLRRILRRVLGIAALVFLAFYVSCAGMMALARWVNPFTTSVQIERRIQSWLDRKPYRKQHRFVPLAQISPHLRHAVIAAEDGRFYQHRGIDWQEVRKVAEESLEEGEVPRGASTISQQLVKNLFLTTSRNPLRKGMEFALVPVLELLLTKDRILELYLNVAEWGPGVWGAEAAAQYHYKTSAAGLSRDQAARLAAILPNPRRRRPARMNDYSARIAGRMQQMGW
ncbi:MAG: monofunctional biosynthetic peptidoglycan transglycosylase [Bryobacteraceae bacterium]|nr:monofunctional biosynthetic peptidoglycan transglycosylase [Bryobacteraceae bacterium]